MYEKLDKLRAEVTRWEQKIEDDKAKLKQAQDKLREAEHSQIIADVGALNLSPEQLAEFLQLAMSGKLSNAGTTKAYEPVTDKDVYTDETEDEMEDFEDEEN